MTSLSSWEFYKTNGLEALLRYWAAGGRSSNGWRVRYHVRIPKRNWHSYFHITTHISDDEDMNK